MTTAVGNTRDARGQYHGRRGHHAEVGQGTIHNTWVWGWAPPLEPA